MSGPDVVMAVTLRDGAERAQGVPRDSVLVIHLDDALVLFAPPFRRVNGAIDVEHERLLHVCAASQFATTQEALCGFTPEHERGWDFPTDLEITKLTTCPDCWNEKGAKKVR